MITRNQTHAANTLHDAIDNLVDAQTPENFQKFLQDLRPFLAEFKTGGPFNMLAADGASRAIAEFAYAGRL